MISKRKGYIIFIIFIIILLALGMAIPAFASEESQFITEPITEFFDWIGNQSKANIEAGDLPDTKKEQLKDATDSSVNFGVQGANLFTAIHQFIVDWIFFGSPIEFDRGIAILISFVVGVGILMKLGWKMIKHVWKWVIGILIFIGIILVLGIQAPSI